MTRLPFPPPPGWYKRVGAASAGGKVGALLERAKGEFSERSPSSPTTETDSVTENPPSFTRCAPPLPVDGNLGFWAGIRSPVLGAVVGVCADFGFFLLVVMVFVPLPSSVVPRVLRFCGCFGRKIAAFLCMSAKVLDLGLVSVSLGFCLFGGVFWACSCCYLSKSRVFFGSWRRVQMVV